MKKLIAITAVAAAGMVAQAGYVLTNCSATVQGADGCDQVVFKLTASGKTAVQKTTKSDDTYMTVGALKISKGYLVLLPDEENSPTVDQVDADGNTNQVASGDCCYGGAAIVAIAKANGHQVDIATDELQLNKWSIFGKNLEKALNKTNMKAGSSVSLETDLGIDTEEPITSVSENFIVRDQDDDEFAMGAIDFHAVAFGTMKYAMSKATKGNNNTCKPTDPTEGCDPVLTWKTYCGWFAGTWGEDEDAGIYEYACVTCECGKSLFGGTWKAVYQARLTGADGLVKATEAVFGRDFVYAAGAEFDDGE